MTQTFKTLADGFFVSPQIDAGMIETAAADGVRLVINNRPDGEEPGQPAGAAIEAAARKAGIAYVAIPVSGMNIDDAHLDRFEDAVAKADGPVLAYCRTGTRSTVLRSLVKARAGGDPDSIIQEAGKAGYDIAGLKPQLDAIARRGASQP